MFTALTSLDRMTIYKSLLSTLCSNQLTQNVITKSIHARISTYSIVIINGTQKRISMHSKVIKASHYTRAITTSQHFTQLVHEHVPSMKHSPTEKKSSCIRGTRFGLKHICLWIQCRLFLNWDYNRNPMHRTINLTKCFF